MQGSKHNPNYFNKLTNLIISKIIFDYIKGTRNGIRNARKIFTLLNTHQTVKSLF